MSVIQDLILYVVDNIELHECVHNYIILPLLYLLVKSNFFSLVDICELDLPDVLKWINYLHSYS